METRSSYILVGLMTIAILLGGFGFAFWLSRYNEGDQREYDIFFQQSVGGLARGSGILYSGVPVGQVEKVSLWEADPEFVRVRIKVDAGVPILQGTVATIAGVGFTGVSQIQLDGAVKGAPALVCPATNPKAACPAGKPVIPTKPGALGEILNSAPLLVERLSTLTERLNTLLSDQNQQSIQGILGNSQELTSSLAKTAPQLEGAIADARSSIANIGAAAGRVGSAADRFSNTSDRVSSLADTAGSSVKGIETETKESMVALRKTLDNANKALEQLDRTLTTAQPAIKTVSEDTLPEINALTQDLREASRSLRKITDRIDQDGVGSVVGEAPLPDYKKRKKK